MQICSQDNVVKLRDDGLQIITSTLYHPDLISIAQNTLLSGNDQPNPLYMLRYHQDRMLAAISDLGDDFRIMHNAIAGIKGLKRLRDTASETRVTSPSKIRFSVDCDGQLTCTALTLGADISIKESMFFPTQLPHPDNVPDDDIKWLIGISHCEIKPGFTTLHKTNLRLQYAKVMEAMPLSNTSRHKVEMLCVNTEQQIMEGCITTPYFWRNRRWTTPDAECGGNLGTTRRWALERGVATEGIIMKEDLAVGQTIVVSNGVWGFGFGKIIAV